MLENIKSNYFDELLFSFVDECQKLKIMKYNKTLQKKINISIYNYKHFKGRYIIYKSKTEGKEFDYLNKLKYKGEFKNGQRNGKGEEFNEQEKFIFSGEYLNGKRNGEGKEYKYKKDNFTISFSGRYLNNKQLIGNKYDIDVDKCRFIETKINLKEGRETEYNPITNYIVYMGEFKNGERNGLGKEYDDEGYMIFKGIYRKDRRWTGEGYDTKENVVYELKNGNGLIKQYSTKGQLLIEAECKNGKINGFGKEYNSEGKLKYEGKYLNGQKNGKGKEYYEKDGSLKFEGEYLYDFKMKGKFYVNSKLEYEGDYLYNKKFNGKGYDENGNVIYELINGNGEVKEYDDETGELIFEGEYLNGKRGKEKVEYIFDKEGKVIAIKKKKK